MSLRFRLVCALVLAALVPMAVAGFVGWTGAEQRAAGETSHRVEQAGRQVQFVFESWQREVVRRVASAAGDLGSDPKAAGSLFVSAADSGIAEELARRFGLDALQLSIPDGRVLSSYRMSPPGGTIGAGGASGVTAGEEVMFPVPDGRMTILETIPFGPFGVRQATLLAGAQARVAGEPVVAVGGRILGRTFTEELTFLTGAPVRLVEGRNAAPEVLPATAANPHRLVTRVPLGDGHWGASLSVEIESPDEARHQLLVAYGGIAPVVVAIALLAGLLMAEGMSRPIRRLAQRAEAIASPVSLARGTSQAAHSADLPVPQTDLSQKDEVKALAASFDRMLESLSDSESERVNAERVAAWQQVARRIAHEVKNPLSPIKLAVENLRRMRERKPGEFDRAFDEETRTILEEVDNLRVLVDEFSRFARLPAPALVATDLVQLVDETLSLFSGRIEAMGVSAAFEPELPSIIARVDPEQIGRVLKNVVANALDAIEGAAPGADRPGAAGAVHRLRISLASADGMRGARGSDATGALSVATPGATPGATSGAPGGAEIRIEDSGPGFSKEVQRHVFEPYYTTKSGRGGTGLGMAIAHRIVVEHGGTIVAGSSAELGGGEIRIRLPGVAPALG